MSRPPQPSHDGSGPPPGTLAGPPPRDLYATSDIRFVLVEIGKLGAQVERLIHDTARHGDKIDQVRHQISFVKGALWVVGGLIVMFGAVVIWYLKARIGA